MAPYRSPEGSAALAELQGGNFDLLLGRRTYDFWANYWPKMKGGLFADPINAATKYVATHHPESLEWGPLGELGADVAAGVRRIKSEEGPALVVWGSTTLSAMLFQEGLVDEVVLAVYPLLLGPGKRFFSESADPRELAFVSTVTAPTGALITKYRYVGAVRTEPA
jgi:dihydrofolate reductase